MRATTSLSVMNRLFAGSAPVDEVLSEKCICTHILPCQPSRCLSIFCPDPLLLQLPLRHPRYWRVALFIGQLEPDNVDYWKIGGICHCPRCCRQWCREEGLKRAPLHEDTGHSMATGNTIGLISLTGAGFITEANDVDIIICLDYSSLIGQ